MIRLILAALLGGSAILAPAVPAAAQPATATAFAPTRFSVVVEGTGRDLILIPGLVSGREVWDGAAEALDGRYRLHRLQLAGFAGEAAGGNAEGEILSGVVEELHAYVQANRLDRPAIAGHSMGGLIAMMLAARHPESAGSVLVVDALPFYSLLLSPDATSESVRPRAAAFRDAMAGMPQSAYAMQQRLAMDSLVRSTAARPALVEAALLSDRDVAARAVYEVMTTDIRPALASLQAPLTVAYAVNEHAPAERVGPLYRSAYGSAPGARLVQVEDSYHFIMLDQPERFRSILASFLEVR